MAISVVLTFLSGEGAKAAVGVEVDLLRVEVLQQLLDPCDNLLRRLDVVGPGIHHSETDFHLVAVFLEDVHLPGTGRGTLQHELVDVHLGKIGKHRPVVAGEQHVFPTAPVAAADVDTGLDARDALQRLVHQPDRELQLVGWVAAVGQGGAHERLGVFLAEHHLAEDGLVQLNEIAALVAQSDYLFPKDGHDVVGEVFQV